MNIPRAKNRWIACDVCRRIVRKRHKSQKYCHGCNLRKNREYWERYMDKIANPEPAGYYI